MKVDWKERARSGRNLVDVCADYIDAYYFAHGSYPLKTDVMTALGISKDEFFSGESNDTFASCDAMYEQYKWFYENMARVNKKGCFEYMRSQYDDYRLHKFAWNLFLQMIGRTRFEHCIAYSLLAYVYFAKLGYNPKLRCGLVVVGSHSDPCHFWLEVDGRVFDIALCGNMVKQTGASSGTGFIFMETYHEVAQHYGQIYVPGYVVKLDEETLYTQSKDINIRDRLREGGWDWTIGVFSKSLDTDNMESFEKYIGETTTIGMLIEEGLGRSVIELPMNTPLSDIYANALAEFKDLLPSEIYVTVG